MAICDESSEKDLYGYPARQAIAKGIPKGRSLCKKHPLARPRKDKTCGKTHSGVREKQEKKLPQPEKKEDKEGNAAPHPWRRGKPGDYFKTERNYASRNRLYSVA